MGGLVRQVLETWAAVLAGGEGKRLRKMTTNTQGIVIPKQYCSLAGSSCLLQDALTRAAVVTMQSRVCTVVAAQHRRWWTPVVTGLNETNVFVQPQNRGTAFGVLLALLTVEMRNPGATLILLPADHYFRDEDSISRVLRVAANLAGANISSTYLLAADPDGPDPELGYILPTERIVDKPASIAGFTEKPDADFARELISLGALWNLFILVGSVNALLQLFGEGHADTVSEMREVLKYSAAGRPEALYKFYERVAAIDFSKDILEVQASRLHVIRVPHCGWTDLGTPKRVETAVRGIATRAGVARERSTRSVPLFFDLGSQYY
jgi:mannose-1-phosphate guanylyltransferase